MDLLRDRRHLPGLLRGAPGTLLHRRALGRAPQHFIDLIPAVVERLGTGSNTLGPPQASPHSHGGDLPIMKNMQGTCYCNLETKGGEDGESVYKAKIDTFEEKDGLKLPSYRGDNINGDAFNKKNSRS